MVNNPDRASSASVLPALLKRHEPTIRRIIQRRSGTRILKRTTIDDLLHETYVSALASAAAFVFVDDNRFLGWISVIARRVIGRQSEASSRALPVTRLRSPKSSGGGVDIEGIGEQRRSPPSSADVHDQELALVRAIEELPEHYQRVLRLYDLEERSLDEVASAMKRTKGATCRLLARARNKLRLQLQG